MPVIRQAATATATGMSHDTIITAASAPMNPITDPTDRSILPPTITSSMPSAMMMI